MTSQQFVVCVNNDGYEASLERNKIYVVLPDRDAERATNFASSTRVARTTRSRPIVSPPSTFPRQSRRPSQKARSDALGGSATRL
jgi:hypothetical protein